MGADDYTNFLFDLSKLFSDALGGLEVGARHEHWDYQLRVKTKNNRWAQTQCYDCMRNGKDYWTEDSLAKQVELLKQAVTSLEMYAEPVCTEFSFPEYVHRLETGTGIWSRAYVSN